MESFLKISNLSVEYLTSKELPPKLALDKTSLEIPQPGYTIGLVGESGSGKTTLGLSILRLIESPGKIIGGSIEYSGSKVLEMTEKELRNFRWNQVAMIYQSAMNSLNPVKSVIDPITEVLRVHVGASKSKAWEKAVNLLSEVGIDPSRAKDYPHEFSGGMRQRVVVALALALSPKLLIADEPTSALDVVVQRQILSLLKREVMQKKLSLLFITHDISILPDVVENIAVMHAGVVVESGPVSKVLFEPLHPYTQDLLAALLTLDSDEKSLVLEKPKRKQESQEPVTRTSNYCKYVYYCRYAFDRCKVERPELSEVDKLRLVACHKYH
ncbi:MAG: ABC transporter ATP-binding protein [Nitrososphaerota archaeon]|nr:ABC transporter ATP-binding protein [Nitrososphaerota archaeon]